MILTLIALIALTTLSMWAVLRANHSSLEFVGVLGVMLGLLGLLVYIGMAVSYIGSSYQADIINREYGTNYTQAEVFYASEVIDTVREIDRNRVEVNGDLINGK